MRPTPTVLLLFLLPITACSSRAGAPRGPGSPRPVGAPGPTTTETAEGRPGQREIEGPRPRKVPVRPDQAPLVGLRDALEADSLLGLRVRVEGRCTAAGVGRKAGSWILTAADTSVEVRGQAPPSCSAGEGQNLTIFAQVERRAAGSSDRLLLRLPD